jgi:hypothetical protein
VAAPRECLREVVVVRRRVRERIDEGYTHYKLACGSSARLE